MISAKRVASKFVTGSDLREDLIKFFLKNSSPSDADFHAWAERKGYNVHKAESGAYELAAENARNISEGTAPVEALRKFLDETKDDWNYITPEEFNKTQKKDWYILDIRRPEDFKKGHIPGAKNIFWLDLLKPQNLKKLPQNKRIVIVCYVGHTASQIMVLLKLLGYDAVGLKFGMGISPVEGVPVAGWTDFGFEVKK